MAGRSADMPPGISLSHTPRGYRAVLSANCRLCQPKLHHSVSSLLGQPAWPAGPSGFGSGRRERRAKREDQS
jgi:hypothetical protein